MGPELVLDRGLGLFEEFRARLFLGSSAFFFPFLLLIMLNSISRSWNFLGGNRAFRSVEQRGGQDVFPQQRAGVLDLTVSR